MIATGHFDDENMIAKGHCDGENVIATGHCDGENMIAAILQRIKFILLLEHC